MSSARVCEVCGCNTSKDAGRCTNGRCGDCHRKHCTPGGDVAPGHGRGTVTPHAPAVLLVAADGQGPKRILRHIARNGTVLS